MINGNIYVKVFFIETVNNLFVSCCCVYSSVIGINSAVINFLGFFYFVRSVNLLTKEIELRGTVKSF